MLGSLAESLMTSILWWRMSQAGTQVDISKKFHTMVRLEKMLKCEITFYFVLRIIHC